jgi:hypothetical protein
MIVHTDQVDSIALMRTAPNDDGLISTAGAALQQSHGSGRVSQESSGGPEELEQAIRGLARRSMRRAHDTPCSGSHS